MSSTIQANKNQYVDLMRQFINSTIDGRTFQRNFFDMRYRDVEQDDEKKKQWPKRYDVELMESRARGEMSEEEFSKRWHELLGYEQTKWLDIFDRLFRDIDRFEPNEAIYEESKKDPDSFNTTYYITEEDLRKRVLEFLQEIGTE